MSDDTSSVSAVIAFQLLHSRTTVKVLTVVYLHVLMSLHTVPNPASAHSVDYDHSGSL